MLYWKYSSNRIFFLNEYWILVPPAVLANYLIIRKIRSNRAKKEELKRLIRQIEREKKIRKLLLLSLGLSLTGNTYFFRRGGSTDFIDVVNTDYIRSTCKIGEGVRYLDDIRVRNIIIELYRHKSKGQIIYITATALCHLTHRYGQMFLALPFAIDDFGLTNLYQTLRKCSVVFLLGSTPALFYIGTPIALFFDLMFSGSGLGLAFNNLDFIPTSPVDATKGLKPRIPGRSDVVVMNNRDKIIMRDTVRENQECWLPYQRLLNSNCKGKPTKTPDVVDSGLPNLRYEDTVNMQDVTGLDQTEFSDKFDLGQTQTRTDSSICKPRQGKEVHFLEKFGDSGQISESEKWDTCDNEFMVPEKKNLRTRNKP